MTNSHMVPGSTENSTSFQKAEEALLADFAERSLASARAYDSKFNDLYANAANVLFEELESSIRLRFIRLMMDELMADSTVTDEMLEFAIQQIVSASDDLEFFISSDLSESFDRILKAGPAEALEVSLAKEQHSLGSGEK